ncbi:MAG: HAD family hydrolase [Collinsella sp.]
MQTYESDANIGSIKILAVDMDKTLLTDERVLPQGLDERLDKLADAGIVFCPASGRPAPKLEEMFEGIKNRLAFCPDNGACVIYRGSYIYKSNIDVELYQQVLSRASEDPRAVPSCAASTSSTCSRATTIPRRDQRLLQHNQLRRQL